MKIFIPVFLTFIILFSFACENNSNGAPEAPIGYPFLWLFKLTYVTGILDLVDIEPPVPPEINEFKDIEYKKIGNHSLKLDIYQPKNIKNLRPVLIFIHGGGWRKGNKEDYLLYLIEFAKRGYVTATISYRLTGEALYPAAVEDVKCAVRWIRSHAEMYLIDPNKIAVIGGSAGGHLAMMIGYSSDVPGLDGKCESDSVSSRVQAVVNLYGPTDLTTEYARTHKTTLNFFGHSYETNPDVYIQGSPGSHITADDPPTLIFHGTMDELVPVSQSDTLQNKLDRAGVINEYHRLKWWPHTMDLAKSVNDYCQYYMNAFFKKHLSI